MKLLSIFGTRPEAIKMAPVTKGLENHPEKVQSLVCVTAQHREMLDQVMNLFEIKPDYDLNIMAPEQNLFDVTCNVIHGLKPVLEKERPHLVLVQGHTTSTMPMQNVKDQKLCTFCTNDTGKELRVYALIDTGADECAFPASFASVLGHNLQAGRLRRIGTGNGITVA